MCNFSTHDSGLHGFDQQPVKEPFVSDAHSDDSTNSVRVVGSGAYQYRPNLDWLRPPEGIELTEAIGVTADAENRIVVFNRGEPPVFVFETDGTSIKCWGEQQFVRPHGITAASDGSLYTVDDLGHRVSQYSSSGEHLRDIGAAGAPTQTGVAGFDYRLIEPGHGPYNLPTNIAVSESGERRMVSSSKAQFRWRNPESCLSRMVMEMPEFITSRPMVGW